MRFDSTSYPLDCPTVLWDALTEVQNSDRNINDELVVAIAKHIGDYDGDRLSDQQERAVRAALDELRSSQPPQLQPEDWLRRTALTEVCCSARI